MNNGKRILLCGANWLGDSIMSMPAIQMFRLERPADRLVMLVKTGLEPLWKMHAEVDQCVGYASTHSGTFHACRLLRHERFDEAYIFPNSFRSAFVPFAAGIPVRVGLRGHGRRILLSSEVELSEGARTGHQYLEYMDILGLAAPRECVRPRLRIPEEEDRRITDRFGIEPGCPLVALMPGAARGPSKRWPQEHFVAVGRWLADRALASIVLGSAAEQDVCASVAAGIGAPARNLAGRTDLPTLVALLGRCRAAVTNDSGGMHLAAAAGTRVVAVFGLTDPGKTGPLGEGHRVVAAKDVTPSRDIARFSQVAAECLRNLRPETVTAALEDLLAGDGP